MTTRTLFAGVACILAFVTSARAATKAELKYVHMCCEGCAEEVAKVLGRVDGVSEVQVEREANTARFTATDAKTAQRAIDALAAAGFHGDTGTKDYAFKSDSGVTGGKVQSLTVTGFHNSCPGCVRSFRKAIKAVEGVTGDTAKPRVNTCEVTGNFDAAAVVEALNKAGFHVRVK